MKGTWKRRWLTLGTLWLLAVLLTYGNRSRVTEVAEARHQQTQLKSELRFHREESTRLKLAEKSAKGLFLEVETAPLGMISIRSELSHLAETAEVKVAAMTVAASQNPEGAVPSHLSLTGSHRDVLRLIRGMESRPYFQTHKLELKRINHGEGWNLEVDILAFLRITKTVVEPASAALAGGLPDGNRSLSHENLGK